MLHRLFLLCVILIVSFNAQAKEKSWAITSADIKWIESEPKELLIAPDYKKWKKKYWIEPSELDGQFKSIRYSYEDVTDDGVDEILLQDTTPYGGGYAFAVFQKKGNIWKMIAHDRGAFIFYIEGGNRIYTLVYYSRDAVDYYRTELNYKNGLYKVVKHGLMSKDITMLAMDFYDYFWSLNFSRYQYCKYQIQQRKFYDKREVINGCKISNLDVPIELRRICNYDDLERYKKEECK